MSGEVKQLLLHLPLFILHCLLPLKNSLIAYSAETASNNQNWFIKESLA